MYFTFLEFLKIYFISLNSLKILNYFISRFQEDVRLIALSLHGPESLFSMFMVFYFYPQVCVVFVSFKAETDIKNAYKLG